MIKAQTELFGHTRARIAARHALITPANHVPSTVPGITGARVVVLVNGAMGAGFAQLLVAFQRGGRAAGPSCDIETFGYVASGGATVTVGGRRKRCGPGGYFFAPARQPWALSGPEAGTEVTLFQKRYVPLAGLPAPLPLIGDASKVMGLPFLGDPAARVRALLPDEPAFDMAVNVFSYKPGAHLPYVEVHIMEHGLLMLAGQGVYRLEDSWYPVQAGDAIWMAPYCAQWFVAMGKAPASYLYYKDVNRAAL
jgi:(S)-ureidoglycine aminohydrolase